MDKGNGMMPLPHLVAWSAIWLLGGAIWLMLYARHAGRVAWRAVIERDRKHR